MSLKNYVRTGAHPDQADAQGSDDRVLLEFELLNLTTTHDEAVRLIGEVETRKAALPA